MFMELYYKDLISEETSLEKLVEDLMLVVQGANEFAEAAGAKLATLQREELTNRLQSLKESCRRLRQQAKAGALATDRVLRDHPYSALGFAFALGLVSGLFVLRKK